MTTGTTGSAGITPLPDGMAGEAELYALFERIGIAWRHHEHPPLFTVADSQALRGELSGAHVKNMFLKDKKGTLFLATCLEDRQIRIRDLERAVGAKGASFGKPDLLADTLGVRPGAVTPFALINDRAGKVRFLLDAGIRAFDTLNAHPLHNEATTNIATADLDRFLAETGHTPEEVDFDALEALAVQHAEAG